ncbi:TetR family transcriptional regulator [Thaumasiovibrio subtropicus]|uniref:TetR family transcriptional regulator n=1 Tax=Thaumasiovibrio subtropicus TaxID=1891207 RepID=UPI000B3616E8|nr:TetR family transcriptional regulator [Thaumasiovibrio subtropicus]
MARKSKQEAEKTRLQLLDSALIVMAERGLAKATLAHIASHAGVTRGAIYWHFKDKDDLLEALWQHIMSPYKQLFDQVEATQAEQLPKLMIDILLLLITEVTTNTRLQSLVRLNYQAFADTEHLTRNRNNREQEHNILKQAFMRVQQAGLLQPHLTEQEASMLFKGFLNGIYQQWIVMPETVEKANHKALATSWHLALFNTAMH